MIVFFYILRRKTLTVLETPWLEQLKISKVQTRRFERCERFKTLSRRNSCLFTFYRFWFVRAGHEEQRRSASLDPLFPHRTFTFAAIFRLVQSVKNDTNVDMVSGVEFFRFWILINFESILFRLPHLQCNVSLQCYKLDKTQSIHLES